MISYESFWNTLKSRNMSQNKLADHFDISKSLLQRMREQQSITLHSIQILCNILDCNSTDIVLVTADEKAKNIQKISHKL